MRIDPVSAQYYQPDYEREVDHNFTLVSAVVTGKIDVRRENT